MISHMIIPSNPLAPSFKFFRVYDLTRDAQLLGPEFLRSHYDLQEANASGIQRQTILQISRHDSQTHSPGLTEKRKFLLRLAHYQMAVNRDEEA